MELVKKTRLRCVLLHVALNRDYSVKGAGRVDRLSALQWLHRLDSSSFTSHKQQTQPLPHMRRVWGLTRTQLNDAGRATDTLPGLSK